MGLIEDLAQQAGVPVRTIGGLSLIDFSDSQAFLDASEKSGVLILGVEGFRLINGKIQPDMNAIADFSYLSKSDESTVRAGEFIIKVGEPGMLFDFTISIISNQNTC